MQRSVKGYYFPAIAVLLVAVMLAAGCSKAGEKETNSTAAPTETATQAPSASTADTAAPEIDTSKEVKLKGYLLGEAPKGMPDVMAELNTRLKKDINATVQVDYVGWGELAAKYPLILATGGDADWIFSADWNNYAQNAAKGGYLELTEDMIKKYMPRYYASIDKSAFKEVSINGKLYMIPSPYLAPSVHVVAIRGDLRKKYGVPEIKRVSDLEPYFAAIKKHEPGMIPAALNGTGDTTELYIQLNAEAGGIQSELGPGVGYKFEDNPPQIYSHAEEPFASQIKSVSATMKSWYDAGYINKDYASNKVSSLDSFTQGKSAIGIANTTSVRVPMEKGNAIGYDVELIPFIDDQGKSLRTPYAASGISLPAGAKNVERTLMFLDLIMSDPDYNRLVYYGIEGKNYVLKDGKLSLPDGVTAESNTYPPDAAGFWFTDQRQFPPSASWSDAFIQLIDDIQNKYSYSSVLSGFTLNTESIKTEIAAMTTAKTQYFVPLTMGSVENIDEAYNTYIEKANAAGLQKVKDEIVKQVNEYLQNK